MNCLHRDVATELVGQASSLTRSAGFQPAGLRGVQAGCLPYQTVKMTAPLCRWCREARR